MRRNDLGKMNGRPGRSERPGRPRHQRPVKEVTMSATSLPPLRLAGYGRCSSTKQEKSVPEQLEWMNGRAEKDGHTLVRAFADEGIPGYEMAGRAQFQRLLEWCEQQHR